MTKSVVANRKQLLRTKIFFVQSLCLRRLRCRQKHDLQWFLHNIFQSLREQRLGGRRDGKVNSCGLQEDQVPYGRQRTKAGFGILIIHIIPRIRERLVLGSKPDLGIIGTRSLRISVLPYLDTLFGSFGGKRKGRKLHPNSNLPKVYLDK